MDDSSRILLCYDGSDDAGTAIEQAASLFPRRHAVAVCFWQPFAQVAKRFAVSLLEVVQEASSVNGREAALAQQLADAGAEIATRGGMVCEGVAKSGDQADRRGDHRLRR